MFGLISDKKKIKNEKDSGNNKVSFISGLNSAYNDLSKIPFEDKIFGFNTK